MSKSKWHIGVFINKLPLVPCFNVLNTTWEVKNDKGIFIGCAISRAYQTVNEKGLCPFFGYNFNREKENLNLSSSVHKTVLSYCNY